MPRSPRGWLPRRHDRLGDRRRGDHRADRRAGAHPEDLDPTCSTSAIIGPGEFRVVMMLGEVAVLNNTGDDVYLVSNRVMAATVVHSLT